MRYVPMVFLMKIFSKVSDTSLFRSPSDIVIFLQKYNCYKNLISKRMYIEYLKF